MSPRILTLDDGCGMTITVMDIGATWLSCRVPIAGGTHREALLGHADAADHLHQPGYLGAIVGRYANRIAQARFALDGREHQLAANEGPHQLHGGPDGFDRRRWQVQQAGPRCVRFGLTSPDGDQGFPGELHSEVAYRIDAPGSLTISIDSTVNAPCPVNLTSHAYFNLDGRHDDVRSHRIRIAAQHYLAVGADLIPTGELVPVAGSAFDLRQPRRIGDGLHGEPQQRLAGGYDHCFVLDDDCRDAGAPAAQAWSADGRLGLSLWTTYPGLQFYSGNHLPQVQGRDGRPYARHAGFALEPQYFPDSPNRPGWPQPDCVQRPGELRCHLIRLRFAAVPDWSAAC